MAAQSVRKTPPKQEMQVWSLGQKDPLEEKMATRSSVLAWKIPWAEEPGGIQYLGSQRVGLDYVCTHTHTRTHRFGLNLYIK